jgi:hypothetical protein
MIWRHAKSGLTREEKLENYASGQFLINKNFNCIIIFTKPLLSLILNSKIFKEI